MERNPTASGRHRRQPVAVHRHTPRLRRRSERHRPEGGRRRIRLRTARCRSTIAALVDGRRGRLRLARPGPTAFDRAQPFTTSDAEIGTLPNDGLPPRPRWASTATRSTTFFLHVGPGTMPRQGEPVLPRRRLQGKWATLDIAQANKLGRPRPRPNSADGIQRKDGKGNLQLQFMA